MRSSILYDTVGSVGHPGDFGPVNVRQFFDQPEMLGAHTAEQWQHDAMLGCESVFAPNRAWSASAR